MIIKNTREKSLFRFHGEFSMSHIIYSWNFKIYPKPFTVRNNNLLFEEKYISDMMFQKKKKSSKLMSIIHKQLNLACCLCVYIYICKIYFKTFLFSFHCSIPCNLFREIFIICKNVGCFKSYQDHPHNVLYWVMIFLKIAK